MSNKITSIEFKKNETIIGLTQTDQPRDVNTVVIDDNNKSSNLPRHADFERAMDKLKPHLLIACDLQRPEDHLGNFLQPTMFDDYFWDDDLEQHRFGGLDVVKIIIQGKNAEDGVQIVGTKTTSAGDVVKIKTPSICLVREPEGTNYSLLDILAVQIKKLLTEAEMYYERKKHGAGVQTTLNVA